MREIKNSGVPWIGEIPEKWCIDRVKHHFVRQNEKAHQDNPTILSLARSGVKVRDISGNEGQMAESYYDYNPVRIGDLLLNPMDLYSGANCNVSYVEGVISPAYMNLRHIADECPRYFDYYFKTQYWAMALFAHGKGISFDNRWTLGTETLFNYFIPLPSSKEQQAIADFLDKKCAEIDEMISLQEKIIEELKAYKQSVITEAVTKGLNPDVPMKDSGVEWIGETPKHWKSQRLKFLCDIETGNKDTQDSVENGEYPFYVRSPKVEHSNSWTFEGEGILMAGDGAGAGRVFHHVFGKYAVHQRVYRLSKFLIFNTNYLFYYISTLFGGIMDMGSAQSTVPSVRLPMLQNFIICLPSEREQNDIAFFLDKKCSEIDSLISLKLSKIEQLKEYKKSIIYEYVTGKKEVEA